MTKADIFIVNFMYLYLYSFKIFNLDAKPLYECSFENSIEDCHIEQDREFLWEIKSEGTATGETGPDHDHTYNGVYNGIPIKSVGM